MRANRKRGLFWRNQTQRLLRCLWQQYLGSIKKTKRLNSIKTSAVSSKGKAASIIGVTVIKPDRNDTQLMRMLMRSVPPKCHSPQSTQQCCRSVCQKPIPSLSQINRSIIGGQEAFVILISSLFCVCCSSGNKYLLLYCSTCLV